MNSEICLKKHFVGSNVMTTDTVMTAGKSFESRANRKTYGKKGGFVRMLNLHFLKARTCLRYY